MKEIADRLRNSKKVILVHGNADMDAIGSAFGIANTYPPAEIYAPGGVDRVARIVSEKLNMNILEECDISNYDLVVVVDTSSPEQFKPGSVDVPENSVVIDHHKSTGKWKGMQVFCDDTKVSCCEIIRDMIKEDNQEISKETALALLGGMLTDSGHFQFANSDMLKTFADTMDDTGIQMDEAMNLTKVGMSMSERIAVMKVVERSKFDRVGDMIVAVSYGSSFEASSCKALMCAGADVVFVGSQREDEFRLSARATQEMVRRGIHLGDLVGELGCETDADGGGHGAAAGMSGIGDVEAMLHMCMCRTMDEFRRIKAEMLSAEPGD